MVPVSALGRLRLPLLLAVAGLGSALSATAQSGIPVVVGYRHNPPYLIADGHTGPSGLAYDVLSAAASRRKISLAWRFTNATGLELLMAGGAQIWPLGDPQDFGQGLGVTRPWASDSYYLLQQAAPARHAGPATRVAVNEAARAMELARRAVAGAQLVTAPGGPAAMERMCKGEADTFFVNARVGEQLLLHRPSACANIALERKVVRGIGLPLGIGYRPEARQIAETLRDEIESMSRDGTLGEHFANWAMLASGDIEQRTLLLHAERNLSRYRLGILFSVGLLAAVFTAAVTFRRAHRLAQQAVQAKEQFVATVSHELRTPLNGFLGLSELLLQTPLSVRQRELAEAIRTSSQSFQHIVEDVLDFARSSQGKLHLQPTPFYAPALIDAVIQITKTRAEERQLYLRAEVPQDAPWLMADSLRLRQVLLNLTDNAIKFTHRGGITLSVRFQGGAEGLVRMCFEVTDTGIGITPELRPHLFEAFRQGDQHYARSFGGLGLGLTVCRALVTAMGGQIEIDSRPGSGTTMRVILSLPRADPPPAPHAEPTVPATGVTRPLRVLVVDDNQTNRHVARRLLEKLGHEVELANGGGEAVARCAAVARGDGPNVDLILMDCQMPEVDGFEATRQIRAQEPAGRRLPIVAVTASVQTSDQEQCLGAGMDRFLAKPVSLQQLSGTIDDLSRKGMLTADT